MKRALIFGASGQIGDALLPLLRETGREVVAVSREARADREGLRWIVGALDDTLSLPSGDFDAVFSLGPLDLFADWLERAGSIAPRVIAFGSTSVATKSESVDPAERDVALRLRSAEESLFAFGARENVGVTILRPTLIYGRGRDRTLSRIAALARRRGMFALPRNANGLRQPVHADDLARAAMDAAGVAQTAGRAYDLPGGETLRFDAMIARTLACLPERPRLLRLPSPLFRAAVGTARRLGMIDAIGPAMLARLDADLVFDAADARRDIGYAPRAFTPEAAMFAPPR
jgi:nucleoside-diphosphate-sugar epimerase